MLQRTQAAKRRSTSRAATDIADLEPLLRRSQRSGVPKYVVLREALLELLHAGRWKPGDKFPSEEELLVRTPYSLGTVQRAMRCLVDKGVLIRRQGLGSFVADLPKRLEHSRHCKFFDDSGLAFLPIYSKVTDRTLTKRSGPWSKFLGSPAPGYLRIDRRISISNEFLIVCRFYCDPSVLGYLRNCPRQELNGANFVALIERKCNVPLRSVGSYVTIGKFPSDICNEIGMKRSSLGLFVQATARTADEQYIYYQEFYVPKVDRALYFSEDVGLVPERHFELP
jgi:GntR family transcriptional regulator